MNDKQLFNEISNEAEQNVPDVYDKILDSAQSQGLLDETSNNAVYSDGDTAVMAGMKKRLIAIAALAAVIFICFAAVLAFGIINSGDEIAPPDGLISAVPPEDGTVIPPEEIALDFGEDYSVGAVSTAKLLGSFMEDSAESAMMVRSRAVTSSRSSASQADNFLKYFNAYDSFFGEHMAQPVNLPITSSKYANSVRIEGMRANGDKIFYQIDYTEALKVDKNAAEGDPVKYYLEGVISGYGQMLLLGERTVVIDGESTSTSSLYICAYPNANNRDTYVRMDIENSDEDGVTVTKYNYTVVMDGSTVGGAVLYKPAQNESNSNIVFALDILGIGGASDVSFDVNRPDADGNEFSVDYKSKYDYGNFSILVTKSDYACVLSDLFLYKLNGDGTCEIVGYDKNETLPEKLAIPSSYDGNKVTTIGTGAFESCQSIKTVCIAEGIEKIDADAFSYSYLEEIEFPNTLREISSFAFYNCLYLVEINLPEQIEIIASGAFNGCTMLERLNIPASVTKLGTQFVIHCTALKSLTVDSGNTAYEGKGNCIIEKAAKKLIAGCKTSIIPADGSVEIIGESAFYDCPITSVDIPNGVKEIESYSFTYSKLERISLPESLKVIKSGAFSYCDELISLHLPSGVAELGSQFLFGCNAITNLTVDDANPIYSSLQNCIVETETKTLIAGCKNSIIPTDGSVENIGDYAFGGIFALTCIDIPYNIISIGSGAFSSTGLTKAVIPDSVSYIGGSVFWTCINLTSVVLPQNMTVIPSGMFVDCFSLEYIKIPECVHTIEMSAFSRCNNLKIIELSPNINTIEPFAFLGCESLENFVIPDGGAEISDGVFYNCFNLSSVTIPVSVTHIGFQAFYGCKSLKEIHFEGTVDEWNAITKDTGWYYDVTNCKVICSDGTLTIDWFEDLYS